MDKKELYQSIKNSDWASIENGLEQSPDILLQLIMRKSLLSYAIEDGRLDQVQMLVERGMPINYSEGCAPPIYTAVENNQIEIIKWLMDQGADVNVSHNDKPLIYTAIHTGLKEIVELVVKNGVDLNCSWGIWDSPLDNAKANDNHVITTLLGDSNTSKCSASTEAIASTYITDANISVIEKTLEISLPYKYRDFLTNLPTDLSDGESIYLSVESIIKATFQARGYHEEEWGIGFTDDLIAVGWDGGSGVYCVRQGTDGSEILYFDHETGNINSSENMTLDEFINTVKTWQQAN